jgi:hypothetical protein
MTTTFVAVTDQQCRAPVSGAPGPDMLVCGEATKPGSVYCPECHTRFYYKPTIRAIKALDFMAGRPLRMGRG